MAGEGCLQDQPEPWAPSPSLPLPSQGEGPRQELAAEAAPTDVVGMTGDAPDIAHHAALDARMVAAARGIKVLTLASWPAHVQQRFLEGRARGHDLLPSIEYPRHDFSDARRELDAIAAAADPAHPLGAYLVESTRSWSTAARLLEALGTPAAGIHSAALYGRPADPLPGDGPTARAAAPPFLDIPDEPDLELTSPADPVTTSPQTGTAP